MRTTKTPRWYFSLRSPYSWLAYRDLLRHYPDVAEAIEWRPYWEPDDAGARMLAEAGGDFPYVAMTQAKSRYVLQDVRRLAERRGLSITWPVDPQPHWEVAHLAYLVAADSGVGREFIDRVYRARWELGLDISDREVIADIGEALGLPRGHVGSAADDPGLRRRGLGHLLDIDRDGAFGVPFFIKGLGKFWGVDRLPDYAVAVRESLHSTVDEQVPVANSVAAADIGHAGGCG